MSGDYQIAGKRVWVAGHQGMIGSALVRRLEREDCEVLTVSRQECDLVRQEQVERWLEAARPQVVIVAAAKVGGILAMSYPAKFLYENLMIVANVIRTAHHIGVERLLFLGPKECSLEGQLESNAFAKIVGVKLCEAYRREHYCDFISVMPTNGHIDDLADICARVLKVYRAPATPEQRQEVRR